MRVNFFGPANTLGVGVHCVNLAKAWEDLGFGREVCLVPPFGGTTLRDERTETWIERRKTFKVSDPSIMIFDSAFLTQFSGTPRIGFAVFETDRLSEVQRAAAASCDWVLVPSKWGQSVLKENYGIASRVVPEGFDPEGFPENLKPSKNKVVTFLHVGKFEERKGSMQTLKCFFNALEKKDAELVMHCRNIFNPHWEKEISQYLLTIGFVNLSSLDAAEAVWTRMGLKVRVLRYETEDMSQLYQSVDVGLFPSKGEGWGLPILECIASGTPAIVGNWTGQSEFLGDNYPKDLTLKKGKRALAYDGQFFLGDKGDWIQPSDSELCDRLLWAYENAVEFRTCVFWAATARRVREFTWQRSAVCLDEFLKDVLRA